MFHCKKNVIDLILKRYFEQFKIKLVIENLNLKTELFKTVPIVSCSQFNLSV